MRSAIDSLREALKLGQDTSSPDNSTFHYHLGMAYAKSGKTTLARQQLQQVLKLNPNSSDAEDAKETACGIEVSEVGVLLFGFGGNKIA